jgi:hypothetical protein
MSLIKEFLGVYRLYRAMHSSGYALQRAYEITFKGLPF